ncbi:hypothetical protein DCC61_00145 [Candidatus Microgenomates bacterium]|nr:hypothetical protein [Candidatus Microgenomates bacterium CPR3]RIK52184.1 MAG: hypothetical protein DCC61_00145 [Candidatus Microgenomates bacterium]
MKKVQQKNAISRVIFYYLLGVVTGLLGIVSIMRLVWHSKFYPNVIVANVNVGGLHRTEAKNLIEQEIEKTKIPLTYNGYSWSLPASALPLNIEETLNQAYRVGRRLDLRDYGLIFIAQKQTFPLVMGEGETESYSKIYEEIAQVVEISVVSAELVLNKGKIVLNNGSDGLIIDAAKLQQELEARIVDLNQNEVVVPTKMVSAQLREEERLEIIEIAAKLIPKSLTLTLDDERVKLTGEELVALLSTTPGDTATDRERLLEYIEGVAESLNREATDAKFGYQEGRVTEFAPSKDGIKISVEATSNEFQEGMKQLIEGEEQNINIEIQAERTSPQVTMDKINELGIKERIGRGESYYAHSIPNRVYNVGLAAERINTALVPPGEEVSFNKLVGEVSAATGYRSAYIISQGRTVLGDGGGLCQVSTTLFRAAMNAGLPILERWGHSYRVSYYEQNSKPGIDATVIAPSKDFRFKNDTPGHILIQTINDPKELHLIIEIYGTSDGRVATVTEPKVWGITPPLPTIYQDDPSLPTGTMKQVDWATGGARTSFEYKVMRNGETLQDQTFSTVYRPWAAVFLRGTGSTPTL